MSPSFLEHQAVKTNSTKIVSPGRDMDSMDAIGKELEANRVILDAGIQDQVQWAQNV